MLADRLFASVWSKESWSASEINTHLSLKLVRQGLRVLTWMGRSEVNGEGELRYVHACSLIPRLTYRVVI